MKHWPILLVLTVTILLAASADAARKNRHEKRFEHYEGTATCLECHEEEAEQFFRSQHYQWRGATPDVVNAGGLELGKLSMVNDFCANPGGRQWIGEVLNEDGKVLAKGCSTCHAGLGKLPSQEVSQEQLENIDCLICHASGYRRDLYGSDQEGWEWKPILWRNQEGMDSVSKRISLPTRGMCLRCHSASGGGPNFKRGDIEYIMTDPPRDFDVHMASKKHGEGEDMQCMDCHSGGNHTHRVLGRGTDMVATDSPGEELRCDGECHGNAPHKIAAVDMHTNRVYCTVCHIPTFARDDPTEVRRDWSQMTYSQEKGKYVYGSELESDVVPSYAWFNGKSWSQIPGVAVTRDDTGAVTMARPLGSKDDADARIHAFKIHRARLPVSRDKEWLLPIATEELYVHGDPDKAVRDMAGDFYGLDDVEFDWTETIRYMGIFHEVVPAENALECLDCHRPGGRMNWAELGYDRDPLENPGD